MRTWDKHRRLQGLLVVVSGPSGVGKDAVLTELRRIHAGIRRCVTTTTRPMRPGEIDGADYHFVSVDEFRSRVEQGGFLEYAEVHGNLYGTPRPWVEKTLEDGQDALLKIDVQGGIEVKRKMPGCVMVFLVPPSLEELERRLRSRLTESDAEIARRLQNARAELEQIPNYDYLIENDSLPRAAEELKAVIVAEHCRIPE